jgi:hypothetical protein
MLNNIIDIFKIPNNRKIDRHKIKTCGICKEPIRYNWTRHWQR